MQLKLLIILSLFSWNTFASSNVTSLINSKGELILVVVDNPSEPPFEAASLWFTMVGSDSNKKIKTAEFSFVCTTTVSIPLNERFGSCRLVVSKEKVRHDNGTYSAMFTDQEILINTVDSNLRLADGNVLFTIDHTQRAVGMLINESLVQLP
jgi:hypothetical protein